MNKKRVASMLLVAATATTGAVVVDNTYANAANQNNSSTIESRGTTYEKGKVVNVTTNLRLRSGKSTSSEVVGYLREGQTFDILAKEGSWYKIKVDGKTGYVYEEYVEAISNSSNSKASEKGVVVNITTNLRVRSGASTSSATLGYLKNGDKLDIVSKSGSWYKIKYKSSYGYVHQDYVKVTSDSSNSNNNNNTNKPETIEKGVVVNITTNLRVRSGASTSSSTLGYLKNGDKLDIVSKSGSWYKIKYKNSYG
ncbi:MAG: SH3 domain-containing protein, partial [Clostridium sp.]